MLLVILKKSESSYILIINSLESLWHLLYVNNKYSLYLLRYRTEHALVSVHESSNFEKLPLILGLIKFIFSLNLLIK